MRAGQPCRVIWAAWLDGPIQINSGSMLPGATKHPGPPEGCAHAVGGVSRTAARPRGSGVLQPPALPCPREQGVQPEHAGGSHPASHLPNRCCRTVRAASLGLLESARMAGAVGQGCDWAEGAPVAWGNSGAGACPEAQAAWRALQSRSESWRRTSGWSRSRVSGGSS